MSGPKLHIRDDEPPDRGGRRDESPSSVHGAPEELQPAKKLLIDPVKERTERLRRLSLSDVLIALGAMRVPGDPHKWDYQGRKVSITGDRFKPWDGALGSGNAINLVMWAHGAPFAVARDWLASRFEVRSPHQAGSPLRRDLVRAERERKVRESMQPRIATPVEETGSAPPSPPSLVQDLIRMMGETAGQAAETAPPPPGAVRAAPPKPEFKPPAADAMITKRAMDWLIKLAGIPMAWVMTLVAKGRVFGAYMEVAGKKAVNMVWPMRDRNNKVVGAFMRGFTPPDVRGAFKGLSKGSSREGIWSHHNDPKKAKAWIVGESPVEALSAARLKGHDELPPVDGDLALVSPCGASLPKWTLDEVRSRGIDLTLAINDDERGQAQAAAVRAALPNVRVEVPPTKDWNKALREENDRQRVAAEKARKEQLELERREREQSRLLTEVQPKLDAWLAPLAPTTRERYSAEIDLVVRWSGRSRLAAVDGLIRGDITIDQHIAAEIAAKPTLAPSTLRTKRKTLESLLVSAGVMPPPAERQLEKKTDLKPAAPAPVASKPSPPSLDAATVTGPGLFFPTSLSVEEQAAQVRVDQWLMSKGMTEATKESYLEELVAFAKFVGVRPHPATALLVLERDPLQVDRLRLSMKMDGKAPSTIRHRLAVLASLLTAMGHDPGTVKLTSAHRVTDCSGPLPKAVDEAIEKLKKRGTREAIRNVALVTLGAVEGLRLTEARGIRLGDLDLDNAKVRIKPKGAKVKAWIKVEARTVDALRTWVEQRPSGHDDYLFVSMSSGKASSLMSVRAIQLMVDALHLPRADGGREEASYHSLRHSAVTKWIDSGMDRKQVTERARWKSPRMHDVYDDRMRMK